MVETVEKKIWLCQKWSKRSSRYGREVVMLEMVESTGIDLSKILGGQTKILEGRSW